MSLKKIISLLNQYKFAAIYDIPRGEYTEQWISNGCALYPLEGLPYIEESNLPALLSVPEKDLKKWRFVHYENAPAGYCFDDDDPGERAVKEPPITFGTAGDVIKPLLSGSRVTFIKWEYLLPVNSDGITMFERETAGGNKYIAVKEGLFIKALIMPYDAFRTEHLTALLEDMARVCRFTLNNRLYEDSRRREAEKNRDQETLFDVDPETGEVKDGQE